MKKLIIIILCFGIAECCFGQAAVVEDATHALFLKNLLSAKGQEAASQGKMMAYIKKALEDENLKKYAGYIQTLNAARGLVSTLDGLACQIDELTNTITVSTKEANTCFMKLKIMTIDMKLTLVQETLDNIVAVQDMKHDFSAGERVAMMTNATKQIDKVSLMMKEITDDLKRAKIASIRHNIKKREIETSLEFEFAKR